MLTIVSLFAAHILIIAPPPSIQACTKKLEIHAMTSNMDRQDGNVGGNRGF